VVATPAAAAPAASLQTSVRRDNVLIPLVIRLVPHTAATMAPDE